MRIPSETQVRADALRAAADRIDAIAVQVEIECRAVAYERAFDSGKAAASIRLLPRVGAQLRRTIRWSTPDPAKPGLPTWLEEGTGIYGPRRTPIVPVRAKRLVFRTTSGAPLAAMQGLRNTSGLIFAKSVRGRPASWVMRDGSRRVAERLGLRWRSLRSFNG